MKLKLYQPVNSIASSIVYHTLIFIGNYIQLAIEGTLRVRIIGRDKLNDFIKKHLNAKEPLENWFHQVKEAEWKTPRNLKAKFPKASIVGQGRVVFRLRGGAFRVVVLVKYSLGLVYIRFVGTHNEYDRIRVKEV